MFIIYVFGISKVLVPFMGSLISGEYHICSYVHPDERASRKKSAFMSFLERFLHMMGGRHVYFSAQPAKAAAFVIAP